MNSLKFSVLLPTYNGTSTMKEALLSLLSQSYDNFEIIVQDDASTDNTKEVVESLQSKKIKFFGNKHNLGYPKNLEKGRKHVTGDILYLMGQDDVLAQDAFSNTYSAFKKSEDIGAVTRPFYWFDRDINTPVRAKKQLNSKKDEIVRITDSYDRLITTFSTLDQLSGLAYRVKFFDIPFYPEIFPAHVYPFASILKKHPVVFLKDYTVAVRIETSHSRWSSTYRKSPMKTWIDLFNNVFYEEEFKTFKNGMISNFVAKNYVGLVQIKNFTAYKYLLREIYYLLKYRWQNIFSPVFWFFSIGTLVIPSFILRPMVDSFKQHLNSNILKVVKDIKFNYEYKI